MELAGYIHPAYAQSWSEFGKPRQLKECGGWMLERTIPGTQDVDAMSCYPLFCCKDWSKLHLDLEGMEKTIVSLAIVTDPFGNYDLSYLQKCFPDKVIPFKPHFILDLHQDVESVLSGHHRRNIRKALAEVKVEISSTPIDYLSDWVRLYRLLIQRHQIKGLQQFSPTAFRRQLEVPGITAFRAYQKKTTIGMILCYQHKNVAYYHLGAYSPLGYVLNASFALFWKAIQFFTAAGFDYLNFGGGAGIQANEQDGLSRFKAGWSSETKMTYFCGRIFDRGRYQTLVQKKGIGSVDYFPAYRAGEFN